MVEGWEKSQDILKEAALKSEKCRNKIRELLKEDLSIENYQKIRKILDEDSAIRNKAIEKSEKIRQNQIKKEEE